MAVGKLLTGKHSFGYKMKHIVAPALSVLVLAGTVAFWTNADYGLEVSCKGETVALVSDTSVIEKARELTSNRISDGVDEEFTPVYRLTVVNDSNTAAEVSTAFVKNDDSVADNLTGLYIDGELAGVCRSSEELQAGLDALISEYTEKYEDALEIGFSAKTEVKEGIFNTEDVAEADEVIKQAMLDKKLQVLVKTEVTETETIPFATKTKYDKSRPKTYKEIKRAGTDGKQETTYTVSYLNGVQSDAVITAVRNIKKPVDKIILRGSSKADTKVYSDKVSSSGFMWPVPSVHNITSTFGYRWGSLHTGIDIADGDCYGAPIVASKAGTVEWAGYDDSGYGNYVIINHGDGTKTLYGHASAVHVSKGQSVSQGQTIASIGSTGFSTGNHCHFEVRTGDDYSDRQDPLNYVSN